MNKKGIMGIGMLIIFIASILVSALAAGVILRATGILQQKALKTEEQARNRLVTMIEPVTFDAYVNTSAERVLGFEILMRLSAGSNDIDVSQLAFTVLTADEIFTASVNASMTGSNCTFDTLNPQERFCIDYKFGGATSGMIGDIDLVVLRWILNSSNYLAPNTNFGVSFIPQEGAYVNLELETPKVLDRTLTHIRI